MACKFVWYTYLRSTLGCSYYPMKCEYETFAQTAAPVSELNYDVLEVRDYSGIGPEQYVIPLIPDLATRLYIISLGRIPDSFAIHGNNSENNASHGCLVQPPHRRLIPEGVTVYVGP